jgi:glycosyltransferase involved in cell wall biosynthesis
VAEVPKISVVIPCFNAEKYIDGTLRSVVSQDWPNLEIIVVDDGSSDRSADLVAASFPDVRLIRQSNAGVAAARNNGISNATGEWIGFVDADDYWLPGKLRLQYEMLAGNPDARMIYSSWREWYSEEPTPSPALVQAIHETPDDVRPELSGWIYHRLLLDCEVWTSTVVGERSLFVELGGFDESKSVGEDYDLWLRASRLTPILRLHTPLALYRKHATSVTRRPPARNYQRDVMVAAIRRWGCGSPNGDSIGRTAVRKALSRTWRDFSSANLLAGRWWSAAKGAASAVALDPLSRSGWWLLGRSILRV